MLAAIAWHPGCNRKRQGIAANSDKRDAKKEVVMMKVKKKAAVNGIDAGRMCRCLLEGVVEIPKRCLLNHECRRCGFDQWLEETDETPRRPTNIAGGCFGIHFFTGIQTDARKG